MSQRVAPHVSIWAPLLLTQPPQWCWTYTAQANRGDLETLLIYFQHSTHHNIMAMVRLTHLDNLLLRSFGQSIVASFSCLSFWHHMYQIGQAVGGITPLCVVWSAKRRTHLYRRLNEIILGPGWLHLILVITSLLGSGTGCHRPSTIQCNTF